MQTVPDKSHRWLKIIDLGKPSYRYGKRLHWNGNFPKHESLDRAGDRGARAAVVFLVNVRTSGGSRSDK
ncbi:hypothetical protein Leryth_011316 [Lithospermum erythrorhizon]|nr:hypothetical protein Leryth_011316 [Lithospermum erythrorhizon]